MLIEAIKCRDCGRIGLAVDGTRITGHKCTGHWESVAQASYRVGDDGTVHVTTGVEVESIALDVDVGPKEGG